MDKPKEERGAHDAKGSAEDGGPKDAKGKAVGYSTRDPIELTPGGGDRPKGDGKSGGT